MELGPIPVVRSFAAVKELPADFQLSAVLDIDGIARPSDGTRSGARKKAASTSADEGDDLTLAGESQPTGDLPLELPQGHINFFA
jgi:hypothetical protein